MVNGLDFKAPVYWFNEIVVKGLDFSVCQFSFLSVLIMALCQYLNSVVVNFPIFP